MKRSITSAGVSKSSRSAAVFLSLAVLLAGCVGLTDRSTTITSEPDNAFIKVNGQNVGNTPVSYPFNLENGAVYRVSAERDGFRTYQVRVRKDDGKIKSGNLHLVLQEDAAWRETTNSEATNRDTVTAARLRLANLIRR